MKKLIVIAAFTALSASAQISVGVLGGVPFTDVVNATNQNNFSYISRSTNYTVGPSLQIGLPLGLRVEVDALYRPYDFRASSTVPGPLATSIAPINASANEWRFPLLAQYRFPFPIVKPFIEGGVSFNHLANVSGVGGFASGPGQFINSTNAGVVLGGGADLKIPFVRLSAELRYTHEGSSYFRTISNVNQAEFLVGVHF